MPTGKCRLEIARGPYRRRLRRVALREERRAFFVNLPLALRGCLATSERRCARVLRLNLPERGEWWGFAILLILEPAILI